MGFSRLRVLEWVAVAFSERNVAQECNSCLCSSILFTQKKGLEFKLKYRISGLYQLCSIKDHILLKERYIQKYGNRKIMFEAVPQDIQER